MESDTLRCAWAGSALEPRGEGDRRIEIEGDRTRVLTDVSKGLTAMRVGDFKAIWATPLRDCREPYASSMMWSSMSAKWRRGGKFSGSRKISHRVQADAS